MTNLGGMLEEKGHEVFRSLEVSSHKVVGRLERNSKMPIIRRHDSGALTYIHDMYSSEFYGCWDLDGSTISSLSVGFGSQEFKND